MRNTYRFTFSDTDSETVKVIECKCICNCNCTNNLTAQEQGINILHRNNADTTLYGNVAFSGEQQLARRYDEQISHIYFL